MNGEVAKVGVHAGTAWEVDNHFHEIFYSLVLVMVVECAQGAYRATLFLLLPSIGCTRGEKVAKFTKRDVYFADLKVIDGQVRAV